MMGKFLKTLWQSNGVRTLITSIAAAYIWLVYRTSRWEVKGRQYPEYYWKNDKPFILCFWHGRLLMAPYAWRHSDKPIFMLISGHRDGQLIAQTVAHFGVSTVAGSSSKGGTQATRSLLKLLKSGNSIGITPDGPRGPFQKINGGLLTLARLGKVDIIPLTYATSRRVILKSWDRFHLPLPFSRGIFSWGKPFSVDSKEGIEEPALVLSLENHMNTLLSQIEEQMHGVPCWKDPQ